MVALLSVHHQRAYPELVANAGRGGPLHDWHKVLQRLGRLVAQGHGIAHHHAAQSVISIFWSIVGAAYFLPADTPAKDTAKALHHVDRELVRALHRLLAPVIAPETHA